MLPVKYPLAFQRQFQILCNKRSKAFNIGKYSNKSSKPETQVFYIVSNFVITKRDWYLVTLWITKALCCSLHLLTGNYITNNRCFCSNLKYTLHKNKISPYSLKLKAEKNNFLLWFEYQNKSSLDILLFFSFAMSTLVFQIICFVWL